MMRSRTLCLTVACAAVLGSGCLCVSWRPLFPRLHGRFMATEVCDSAPVTGGSYATGSHGGGYVPTEGPALDCPEYGGQHYGGQILGDPNLGGQILGGSIYQGQGPYLDPQSQVPQLIPPPRQTGEPPVSPAPPSPNK